MAIGCEYDWDKWDAASGVRCVCNRSPMHDGLELTLRCDDTNTTSRHVVDERIFMLYMGYELGQALREDLDEWLKDFCAVASIGTDAAVMLVFQVLSSRVSQRHMPPVTRPAVKPKPDRKSMRRFAWFLGLCASEASRGIPGDRL